MKEINKPNYKLHKQLISLLTSEMYPKLDWDSLRNELYDKLYRELNDECNQLHNILKIKLNNI